MYTCVINIWKNKLIIEDTPQEVSGIRDKTNGTII